MSLKRKTIHLVDIDGLPTFELVGLASIQVDIQKDTVSGGTLTFNQLQDPKSAAAMEISVEFCLLINNTIQKNCHFELTDSRHSVINADGAALEKEWTFQSITRRFAETPTFNQAARFRERKVTGTAGEILGTFWTEAHDRFDLIEFSRDWFDATDSSGDAWDKTWTMYVQPEWTIEDILAEFRENQIAEWEMRGHMFHMWNYGGAGNDYATPGAGLSKIIWQSGVDIIAVDRQATMRGMANVAIVGGADKRWAVAENAGSITDYKRRTKIKNASAISDQDTLQQIADSMVEQFRRPITYKTYKLLVSDEPGASPAPFTNAGPEVGDFVGIADGVSLDPIQRGRIAKVTATWGDDSEPEILVDIDLRFARIEERIEARIDGLNRRRTGPATEDRIKPSPPTSLTYTTGVTSPAKGPQTAWLLPAWTNPTTDEDGEPLEDLDRMWVYYESGSGGKPHRIDAGTDASAKISGLALGTDFVVRVRAQDESGHLSDALGPSTMTTATGTGTYYATDAAGDPIFELDGTRSKQTKSWVRGVSTAGTGAGLRETETDFEVWNPIGDRTIHIDYTLGSAHFSGDVLIDGDTIIGGTTTLEGLTTIDDDLIVNADTEVHGDLLIDGNSEIAGSLEISANLDVTGTTHLGGTLTLDSDLDADGHTITGGIFETTSGTILGGVGLHDLEFSDGSWIGSDIGGVALHAVGFANIDLQGDVTTDDLKVGGDVGFYNTSPQSKPTVTGSRGGNAALASLLTALDGLGLITNSTSA